jgi:hypothetical protein
MWILYEIGHKNIYKFCFKNVMLPITNMAMVRNSEVMSRKFYTAGACRTSNYALKLILISFNYTVKSSRSFIIQIKGCVVTTSLNLLLRFGWPRVSSEQPLVTFDSTKHQYYKYLLLLKNSQCPSRLSVRMWRSCDAEKLKLSSDGIDSGSKKCKRRCGGVWRSPRLAGVRSQAVGFVLVRLAGIWRQSPWRCFQIIYFTKKFYKFCTFNAIRKDNAAINCIIVQHKETSYPSILTGHTLG